MIQNIPNFEHSLSLWLVLQEFGQDFDTATPAHDHYCADSGSKWMTTAQNQAPVESVPV